MASRAALRNIQELRLHLSQTSSGSAGLRKFVEKYYPELRKANPDTPILVREAAQAEAKIFARYDKGEEAKVSVEGLTLEQIVGKMSELQAK